MVKQSGFSGLIINLIGYALAFVALFPLTWMAIAGFKDKKEVLSTPFKFFPKEWLFTNYTGLIQDPAFLRTIAVTLFGAVVFTSLMLLINSMAAFVFARLEFPFKKILWLIIISTLFIPGLAILIPSFIVVSQLGMLDKLIVLIVPGIASAGNMFFIRQFYLNIPLALEEAALIDGASRFKTYVYIFLPMSLPPFVIVGIGGFLAYWNAYIWPVMTIVNPDLYQIMQYLATFRSERGAEHGLLMAGATLAAIPIILLFLTFQRYLIENIKISGLR